MNPLWIILLVSWLAGIAGFVGGTIAFFEGSVETPVKREIIHGIIAFGGGILLAAVAFALVPEGMNTLSPPVLASTFCAGGLAFCVLDAYLTRRGQSEAQFMAMLMDFLPEAISMGAVFGHDRRLGTLLAVFIGVQNLPEGFNAFRELSASGKRPWWTLLVLAFASLFGPAAAALGYFFLQERAALSAGIMVFAGGGVLYLIFQDIAPQSKMQHHWMPPFGAVLGFVFGVVGKMVIG